METNDKIKSLVLIDKQLRDRAAKKLQLINDTSEKKISLKQFLEEENLKTILDDLEKEIQHL